MSRIKDLQKQITDTSGEAKSLYAEMEADAAKQTAENREKLDKILAKGKQLRADLQQAQEVEELDEFVNKPKSSEADFAPVGSDGDQPQANFKSWGRTFTDSPEFKAAAKNNSPNVPEVQVKALYESATSNGGATVFSDRRTDVIERQGAKLAPTTLLDIMNISPTDSSSIDYIQMTGFTNNAAEVKEWDSGTSNYGLKPESDMAFALINAPVQTIAHWMRASRNLLSDQPAMRNFIDTKLIDGLRARLEGQIIAGNGTAPNLRGILNTSGIQTRSGATGSASARFKAGDTKLDTIRRAITDVALAFGSANAIVLNPADAEDIELAKDDNKNYMNVYDAVAQRVWRVRVVENQRVTANRGIVGDFAGGATLYMREDAIVRVSENVADDFIRNAIRVLAELRAALAVEIPEYFVDINTLATP